MLLNQGVENLSKCFSGPISSSATEVPEVRIPSEETVAKHIPVNDAVPTTALLVGQEMNKNMGVVNILAHLKRMSALEIVQNRPKVTVKMDACAWIALVRLPQLQKRMYIF